MLSKKLFHVESLKKVCLTALVVLMCGGAWGTTYTWNGAAGDGNWETTSNWTPAGTPGNSDNVTISGESVTTVTINSNITIANIYCNTSNSNSITLNTNSYKLTTSAFYVGTNDGYTNASDSNVTITGNGEIETATFDFPDKKQHILTIDTNTTLNIEKLYGNSDSANNMKFNGTGILKLPASGADMNYGSTLGVDYSNIKTNGKILPNSTPTYYSTTVTGIDKITTDGATLTLTRNGSNGTKEVLYNYTFTSTNVTVSYSPGNDFSTPSGTLSAGNSKSNTTYTIKCTTAASPTEGDGFKLDIWTPDNSQILTSIEWYVGKPTWTGATSQEWSNSSNWLNADPATFNTTTEITINSSATRMPEISSNVSLKKLTVNENASVVINSGSLSVEDINLVENATLSQSGGTVNVNNITLTGNSKYTASAGELIFNSITSSLNSTVADNAIFFNLNIPSGNALNVTGNLNINGTFTTEGEVQGSPIIKLLNSDSTLEAKSGAKFNNSSLINSGKINLYQTFSDFGALTNTGEVHAKSDIDLPSTWLDYGEGLLQINNGNTAKLSASITAKNIKVDSSATFNMNGFNTTVDTITNSGTIVVGSKTLKIKSYSASGTNSIKIDGGSLDLSNASTLVTIPNANITTSANLIGGTNGLSLENAVYNSSKITTDGKINLSSGTIGDLSVISGTTTLTGDTTVDAITIETSSELAGASGKTITVNGDWTNNGTYTHNSGVVKFIGDTTVTGANTFKNLEIEPNIASATIIFPSAETQNIGSLSCKGTSTNKITLKSSSVDPWKVCFETKPDASSFTYTIIQNSESVDSADNPNNLGLTPDSTKISDFSINNPSTKYWFDFIYYWVGTQSSEWKDGRNWSIKRVAPYSYLDNAAYPDYLNNSSEIIIVDSSNICTFPIDNTVTLKSLTVNQNQTLEIGTAKYDLETVENNGTVNITLGETDRSITSLTENGTVVYTGGLGLGFGNLPWGKIYNNIVFKTSSICTLSENLTINGTTLIHSSAALNLGGNNTFTGKVKITNGGIIRLTAKTDTSIKIDSVTSCDALFITGDSELYGDISTTSESTISQQYNGNVTLNNNITLTAKNGSSIYKIEFTNNISGAYNLTLDGIVKADRATGHTFDLGNKTVTFKNGFSDKANITLKTNAVIYGDNSFSNLTIDNSNIADATSVTFESDKTQTISALSAKGNDENKKLTLGSTNTTPWKIYFSGLSLSTDSFSHVKVSNSSSVKSDKTTTKYLNLQPSPAKVIDANPTSPTTIGWFINKYYWTGNSSSKWADLGNWSYKADGSVAAPIPDYENSISEIIFQKLADKNDFDAAATGSFTLTPASGQIKLKSFVIETGNKVSLGDYVFTVTEASTVKGTLAISPSTAKDVITNGKDTFTDGSTIEYYGASTVMAATNISATDYKNLTVESGTTLELGVQSITVSAILSNEGTINVNGTGNLVVTGTPDTDSGLIKYSTDKTDLGLSSFFDLEIDAGSSTVKIASDTTVNRNFTVSSGTVGGNKNLTVKGDFTDSGTWTNTGKIILSGSENQDFIPGGSTYPEIEIASDKGTSTVEFKTYPVNATTITAASGNVTFKAGGTIKSDTTFTTTGKLTFEGSPISFTDDTPTSKNLTHTAGDTEIKTTLNCAELSLAKTTNTAAGAINSTKSTFAGDYTATGSLTSGSGDTQFNANATFDTGASFTASTGTVIFGGTTILSITPSISFNNVQINDGKSLSTSSNFSVGGNWDNQNTIGGFTASSSSEITFTGATPEITGENTFYTLSFKTPDATVKFENGKTQTAVYLNSVGAVEHPITLTTNAASPSLTDKSTWWKINLSNIPTSTEFTYTDVEYSISDPTNLNHDWGKTVTEKTDGSTTNWFYRDYYWFGKTDTNWSTASNWSFSTTYSACSVAPKHDTGLNNIIIQDNDTHELLLANDINVKSITVNETKVLDLVKHTVITDSFTNNGIVRLQGILGQTITGTMINGSDSTIEYYGGNTTNLCWDGDSTTTEKDYQNLTISGKAISSDYSIKVEKQTVINTTGAVEFSNPSNSFLGAVTLTNGGDVILNAASEFTLNNNAKANSLTVQSAVKVQNITTTNDLIFKNAVTLSGDSDFSVTGSGNTISFAADVSGGTNTLTLNGNSTITSSISIGANVINASGTLTIPPSYQLSISGDFTNNTRAKITGSQINISGNLSDSGTWASNINFNGSSGQTFTANASTLYSEITNNNTHSDGLKLNTNINTNTITNNGAITVGANTLQTKKFTTSEGVTNSISVTDGTLTISGNSSQVIIPNLSVSSSATLNGDSVYGLKLTNATYNNSNLTTTGIVELSQGSIGNLSISGGKTSLNGTITASNILINNGFELEISGTNTLTVNKNWTNNNTTGGFTANSSKVIFDETGTHTISGSQTFYDVEIKESTSINGSNSFTNLTAQNLGGKTITFEAGKTQTVSGKFTAKGTDSDNLLKLVSSIPESQWLISSASHEIEFVDVIDSNNTSANRFTAAGPSKDSGNNDRWNFTGKTYKWTGLGTDSNWFNKENWDIKSVPGIGAAVIIQETANPPVLEHNLEQSETEYASVGASGTLTIESAAQIDFTDKSLYAKSITNKGLVRLVGTQTIKADSSTPTEIENATLSTVEYYGDSSTNQMNGTVGDSNFYNLKFTDGAAGEISTDIVVANETLIANGSSNALTLSGKNTFTGEVTISTAGDITLNANSLFSINANADANSLIIQSDVTLLGDVTTSTAQTYNGKVQGTGSNNIIFTATNVTFNKSVLSFADITVDSPVNINATEISSVSSQLFKKGVTLGENTTLTASDITFESNVDGGYSLFIIGNATFEKNVGSNLLTSLSVSGNTVLKALAQKLSTSQNQIFAGTVTGENQNITFNANKVTFNNNVSDFAELLINGQTDINASVITSSNKQNYNGSVILLCDTTLTAPDVIFESTIDGHNALNIAGNAKFESTIGAVNPPAALTVTGTSAINTSSVITTGEQTYKDAVSVGSQDSTFNATNINLFADISGTNNIDFQSKVTLSSTSITFKTGNDKNITFNQNILGSDKKAILLNGTAIFKDDVNIYPSIENSASIISENNVTFNSPFINKGILTCKNDSNNSVTFKSTYSDSGSTTTFNAGAGTVIFNADVDLSNTDFKAQSGTVTLSPLVEPTTFTGKADGSSEFYDFVVKGSVNLKTSLKYSTFTAQNLGGKTITFEAGKTQTVSGKFTAKGTDSDNLLKLVSSIPGSQWIISSASHEIEFVDVIDSNNTSANRFTAAGPSKDSGNNDRWNFTGKTYKWTGLGADSNWFNKENWDIKSVPGIGAAVIIQESLNPPVLEHNLEQSETEYASVGASGTLTIESAAQIDFTDKSLFAQSITNKGLVRLEGTQTIKADSSTPTEIENAALSTVEYYGDSSTNQMNGTVGDSNFYNLKFTNGAAGEISTDIVVANETLIANGSSNALTLSGKNTFTGEVTIGNHNTVPVTKAGNITLNSLKEITISPNATAEKITITSQEAIKITGSISSASQINFTGNLITTGGASAANTDFISAASGLNINGNWSNDGYYTNSASTQIQGDFTNNTDKFYESTSSAVTVLNGNLENKGTLTFAKGITVSQNFTDNGIWINNDSGVGNITFNGTENQTVSLNPETSYQQITVSKADESITFDTEVTIVNLTITNTKDSIFNKAVTISNLTDSPTAGNFNFEAGGYILSDTIFSTEGTVTFGSTAESKFTFGSKDSSTFYDVNHTAAETNIFGTFSANNINLALTNCKTNLQINSKATTFDGNVVSEQNVSYIKVFGNLFTKGNITIEPNLMLDGSFTSNAETKIGTNQAPSSFYLFTEETTPADISVNAVTVTGDLIFSAPRKINTSGQITASNIVLYKGDIIAADNSILFANNDVILLGQNYNIANSETNNQVEYIYQNNNRLSAFNYIRPDFASVTPGQKEDYFPDGNPLPTGSNTSNQFQSSYTAGASSIIHAQKNFYANGLSLSGDSIWFVDVPDLTDAKNGFGEAYNCEIKYSTVRCYKDNSDDGSLAQIPCYFNKDVQSDTGDRGNNKNWIFDDFAFTDIYTVRDDCICIEFNRKIRNLNGELLSSLSRFSNSDSKYVGFFKDPDCTIPLENQNIDTLKVYLKAEHSWNTDATGNSAGSAFATDRNGVHKEIIPYVEVADIASGELNNISDLWGKKLKKYSGDFRYTNTKDKTGPVLYSVKTGQEIHTIPDGTAESQHSYDAHNFIEFRYSEPVNFGKKADESVGVWIPAFNEDGSVNLQENVKVTDAFGALKNDITTSEELNFANLANIEHGLLYTGSNGQPDKYVNSLYRKDEYSLCLSIAGYTEGEVTNPDNYSFKRWVGYIEKAEMPSGKVNLNFETEASNLNPYVTDVNENPQEDYQVKTQNIVPTVNQSNSNLYGKWDLSEPVFVPLRMAKEQVWNDSLFAGRFQSEAIGNTSGTGSTLDRIEFHLFDNTPDFESLNPEWMSEIGWINPNSEGTKADLYTIFSYSADIFGGSRPFSQDENYRTSGGIRYSTIVNEAKAFKYVNSMYDEPNKNFVNSNAYSGANGYIFTGTSSPRRSAADLDGLYFGLPLGITNYEINTTFTISYDSSNSYITDLAGNRLRSKTFTTIDRTPPSFNVTLSPINKNEIYITFVKQIITDSSKLTYFDNDSSEEIDISRTGTYEQLIPSCFKIISIDSNGNPSDSTTVQIDKNIPAKIIKHTDEVDNRFTSIKLTLTQNVTLNDVENLYISLVHHPDYSKYSQDPLTSHKNSLVTFIQDYNRNYMEMYSAHALSDFAIDAIKPLYGYDENMTIDDEDLFNGLYQGDTQGVHDWNADQKNYGTLPAKHALAIVAENVDGTEDNENPALNARIYLTNKPDSNSEASQYNSDFNQKLRIWLPNQTDTIFAAFTEANNKNYIAIDSNLLDEENPKQGLIFHLPLSITEKWNSGDQISFLFALTDSANIPINIIHSPELDINSSEPKYLTTSIKMPLYALRLTNPDDITSIDLWSFKLRTQTKQRGGISILNNVINPVEGEKTIIEVDNPSDGNVNVIVMTLDGNIITYLNRGELSQGEHFFTWDGKTNSGNYVARGLYFVRILGNGFDETRKIMVVK